jgi:ATP-dependent protease HslVU (ClpYQ) peptidase subunit
LTTIAYRDGTISADTRITYNSYHNGNRHKLALMGRYIVGLAGETWLRRPLEQWVEQGCPEAEVPEALLDNDDKFEAMLIDPDGKCFNVESGFLVPVEADYAAIGSGGMFALGAMAHGADSADAVAAAARHDKNTGGNIQSLHFSVLSNTPL